MITQLPTILYAVVAAVSPLAFSATLVVLKSDRGRLNGALFTVGFVCAEAVIVMIALLVDTVPFSTERGRPLVASILGLVAGAVLIALSVVIRRRPATRPDRAPGRPSRSSRLLTRLSRLSPAQAVAAGLALGVGGPRRLAMTLLAATTISAAVGRMSIKQMSLAAIFVVVACSLVWVPALVYLTSGAGALARLERLEAAAATHRREVMFYGTLALGVILTVACAADLLRR